jgi:PAS domain S-box-containing protein
MKQKSGSPKKDGQNQPQASPREGLDPARDRLVAELREEKENAQREREKAEAARSEAALLTEQIEGERRRLRELVASVPGVVWEAWGVPDEASQRMNFVSDYVEQMLGYTVDEWLSTPNFWLSIVHPEDRESAARVAREKFESLQGGLNEFRWVAKDGRVIPVEAHSVPVLDERGEPVGMRGVTMDISARKRIEAAVLERARLAALGADVGTALTQDDSLPEILRRVAEALVTHLDAAFARVWTLNEAEDVLELQASAGLYTHTDGPHSRVPVGKFKIGLIAQERRPHLTNDVLGDPRVGDKEWAEREGMVAFAGYPLMLEERLVGVMALFSRASLTEVTLQAMEAVANGIAVGIERKQAEAELRASEQRYRALTNAMPQLVWATDENGLHFYYNRGWYEYTGLSEEESLGFGFTNALHPDDKQRTLQQWERAWRAGEGYEIEYRFYSRPLEQYRWFLGRAVPVRDEAGRVTQWVGTCTDIEEQKQMEALLARLNEERERMIEEVSTPVVPVLEGVLVLPLIGSLDTVRMERATHAALHEVTRTGARCCIIDITGARIIDSHAVSNLSNLMMALKLVGAEAIVTGIGVHAAQSLVGLGLDLQGMRTHRTLAQALSALISDGHPVGRRK